MQHHQAALLEKAVVFCRRAYVMLPWGVRVADLMARLAFTDPRADFGRLVYSIFIRHGVRGLPDIGGQDALTVPIKLPNKLAPPGYGKEFGDQLWRRMLAKYKDPELVKDAMQSLAVKLLGQSGEYLDNITLNKAEGHVFHMLDFSIQDVVRAPAYRKREGLGEDTDDEEHEFQVLDRDTLRKLDDMILPNDMHKIKQRLIREVHPDAARYVEFLLEGYTAKEIVGDPHNNIPSMLPHLQKKPMSYQHWDAKIRPEIYHIFRDTLAT